MQAHIHVRDEQIPAPRFSIGDPVVHKVDELNRPGSEWYDSSDSERLLSTWWHRGIITGMEWNCGYEDHDNWSEPGWVYKVRRTDGDEPDAIASGRHAFSEMAEQDLRPARAQLNEKPCQKFSGSLKSALSAIICL